MEERSFVSQKASPWTDGRLDHLKVRWSQGATARQISQELGHGISRCAVLGKIHRLRIEDASPHVTGPGDRIDAGRPVLKPVQFAGAERSRRPRVLPTWVVNAKPYIDDVGVDADIPHSQRRSFSELNGGTCRWPVSEPGQSNFFFCGVEPLPTKPYCAAHCARAYRRREAAPAPDVDPTEQERRND
jgi:GcrA cell cycle regulator